MPRKTPRPGQGGSNLQRLPRVVEDAGAPHRVTRAVELLTPRLTKPSMRYVEAQETLCKEFRISPRTAAHDLAKAYVVLKDRLAATDVATVVRTELEGLARRAEFKGDEATAVNAWARLAKLAGLEVTEVTVTHKLSDAELTAAIDAEIARRLETMPDDEFGRLMERRVLRKAAA